MCSFDTKLVTETDPKTGEVTRRYTKTGKKLVDCLKTYCKWSKNYQKWWVLRSHFALDLGL
jgi:hypothetical protein